MPNMTGLELLARVREMTGYESLSVAMITAAAADLFEAAQLLGADRVLPKPLRASGMRAIVLSLLRLRENSRVSVKTDIR